MCFLIKKLVITKSCYQYDRTFCQKETSLLYMEKLFKVPGFLVKLFKIQGFFSKFFKIEVH